MNGYFDPETLQLLDETREVRIETRRDESAPAHRTIIWVVTVEGNVFVRAVPVTDEPTVGAVSEACRSKYEQTAPGPTRAMVRPDTLPTTLKLEPA